MAFYLSTHTVKVAMIGDSIVSQMAPRQSGFPAPFAAATNLGVSGNSSSQVLARVSSIPSDTTHVVLQMGTNDLVAVASDALILPNYAAMLTAIPSRMRVITWGILPTDDAQMLAVDGPSYVLYLNNPRIHLQNTMIATLCNSFSNCVVASGIMAKNMIGKTVDGIHPVSAAVDIELLTALMPLLGL